MPIAHPIHEEIKKQPSADRPVSLGKRLRRLLLGRPLHSERLAHTLLPKWLALPVFASDAISSTAYATQEIILVLGGAGLALTTFSATYTQYTLLLAGLITLLLAIVATSYWQTIFAYPGGGGSYIVSKDNLGRWPGLIAAAALLIDYVLTVSVSIAAGVQNLASIPIVERYLHPEQHLVLFCVFFIALLTLANMRGLKESGTVFAIPTYIFVGMILLMLGTAIAGPLFGWQPRREEIDAVYRGYAQMQQAAHATGMASLALLLNAFASGCAAMTGTEAVSNGIPAFQEPKSKNAALTLLWMAIILGTLFMGISWLATRLHVVYYSGAPAVIDQLSGAVFGKTGTLSFFYYATQVFTALILVLAANTCYADFPRLSSILARDSFLPKQLANLGDKLVFNNGILLLGLAAAVVVWARGGNVDALIPLYATGVFTAFTMSQSGMVRHWMKLKSTDRGWLRKAAINGIGAVATFVVLCTVVYEKFSHGAWVIVILIAILVFLFHKVWDHYADVAVQLRVSEDTPAPPEFTNTVLLLMPGLHRGVLPAIAYAQSLSPDCRAVYIDSANDPEKTQQLRQRWERYGGDIPLLILNSPFRSLLGPIINYVRAVERERQNHVVTVIVPEFVPTKWWHTLLHGNNGFLLKLALLREPNVVVTNVRYHLRDIAEPHPEDVLEEIPANPDRSDRRTAAPGH